MEKGNYKKLGLMMIVSFCVMYFTMFLSADSIEHVYLNAMTFYMTLLMVLPMTIIMFIFMPKMYMNRKINIAIILSCVVGFIVTTVMFRNQTFVSDKQFLKSMIPHHSSAILMSKNAKIEDPEVARLSKEIIESQEIEIEEMKKIIERLGNK